MPATSAGLLLYREVADRLEVLLVHPGGPFWASKDEGAWSIPKGLCKEREEPLDAARREFEEETGHAPHSPGEACIALKPVRQPGGKRVFAWAVRGDFDPANLRSNSFVLEWPPRSGEQRSFPEADRAAWMSIDLARSKILKAQVPLLDDLESKLGRGSPGR